MEYNVTEHIEASTSSTTGSLTEVESREEDRIPRKDYSLARHVDTQCKRSCRDDNPQVASSEKHLHAVSVLAVHTSVMDTNPAPKAINQPIFHPAATHLIRKVIELFL
jgi:hypothetical protein